MSLETDGHPRSATDPSTGARRADAASLSPDDIFHILQTSRRRETIRFLLDRDGAVKMRDIAEHVAALEHETTVAGLSSTQRQRVYIPLYQSHLPTLDEEGVVDYDKSRGIVRPTETLELFRPYLEMDTRDVRGSTSASGRRGPGESRRDRRVVAGVSVASLLLSGAVGTLAATTVLGSSPILAVVIGVLSLLGMGVGTVLTTAVAVVALTGTDPAEALERLLAGDRSDRPTERDGPP